MSGSFAELIGPAGAVAALLALEGGVQGAALLCAATPVPAAGESATGTAVAAAGAAAGGDAGALAPGTVDEFGEGQGTDGVEFAAGVFFLKSEPRLFAAFSTL